MGQRYIRLAIRKTNQIRTSIKVDICQLCRLIELADGASSCASTKPEDVDLATSQPLVGAKANRSALESPSISPNCTFVNEVVFFQSPHAAETKPEPVAVPTHHSPD